MFWGQPSVALNALVKLVFSYRPPLLTPLHKLGFGFGTNHGHPSAHHRGWDDPAHGPGTQQSLGTIPSMQSHKHMHGVGTHGSSGPDKVWDKDFWSWSNQESCRLGCDQQRHLRKGAAFVAFRR